MHLPSKSQNNENYQKLAAEEEQAGSGGDEYCRRNLMLRPTLSSSMRMG